MKLLDQLLGIFPDTSKKDGLYFYTEKTIKMMKRRTEIFDWKGKRIAIIRKLPSLEYHLDSNITMGRFQSSIFIKKTNTIMEEARLYHNRKIDRSKFIDLIKFEITNIDQIESFLGLGLRIGDEKIKKKLKICRTRRSGSYVELFDKDDRLLGCTRSLDGKHSIFLFNGLIVIDIYSKSLMIEDNRIASNLPSFCQSCNSINASKKLCKIVDLILDHGIDPEEISFILQLP